MCKNALLEFMNMHGQRLETPENILFMEIADQ